MVFFFSTAGRLWRPSLRTHFSISHRMKSQYEHFRTDSRIWLRAGMIYEVYDRSCQMDSKHHIHGIYSYRQSLWKWNDGHPPSSHPASLTTTLSSPLSMTCFDDHDPRFEGRAQDATPVTLFLCGKTWQNLSFSKLQYDPVTVIKNLFTCAQNELQTPFFFMPFKDI